jgi:hypothetical protein
MRYAPVPKMWLTHKCPKRNFNFYAGYLIGEITKPVLFKILDKTFNFKFSQPNLKMFDFIKNKSKNLGILKQCGTWTMVAEEFIKKVNFSIPKVLLVTEFNLSSDLNF